jgi:hypothetical protein
MNASPTSQGSRGRGATRGRGPQDSAACSTQDGSDSAPEPDSAMGAVVAGGASTMSELTTEVSSSQTQSRAATTETVPEVDMTTTTGAAMAGDSDKLEVVTGHLGL